MLLKLISNYVEGHKQGEQTKIEEYIYRVEINEILDEHEKYYHKPLQLKYHYKNKKDANEKSEELKKINGNYEIKIIKYKKIEEA